MNACLHECLLASSPQNLILCLQPISGLLQTMVGNHCPDDQFSDPFNCRGDCLFDGDAKVAAGCTSSQSQFSTAPEDLCTQHRPCLVDQTFDPLDAESALLASLLRSTMSLGQLEACCMTAALTSATAIAMHSQQHAVTHMPAHEDVQIANSLGFRV